MEIYTICEATFHLQLVNQTASCKIPQIPIELTIILPSCSYVVTYISQLAPS